MVRPGRSRSPNRQPCFSLLDVRRRHDATDGRAARIERIVSRVEEPALYRRKAANCAENEMRPLQTPAPGAARPLDSTERERGPAEQHISKRDRGTSIPERAGQNEEEKKHAILRDPFTGPFKTC